MPALLEVKMNSNIKTPKLFLTLIPRGIWSAFLFSSLSLQPRGVEALFSDNAHASNMIPRDGKWRRRADSLTQVSK